MKKLFVVVRKDLTPSQQAVQAGHALAEYMLHSLNLRWKNETLIYLGVKDLYQLEKLMYKLSKYGVNYYEFKEPDLNNETTAISTDQECVLFNKLNLL
jgi:hypothetical protein